VHTYRPSSSIAAPKHTARAAAHALASARNRLEVACAAAAGDALRGGPLVARCRHCMSATTPIDLVSAHLSLKFVLPHYTNKQERQVPVVMPAKCMLMTQTIHHGTVLVWCYNRHAAWCTLYQMLTHNSCCEGICFGIADGGALALLHADLGAIVGAPGAGRPVELHAAPSNTSARASWTHCCSCLVFASHSIRAGHTT
jgi:hypothetical protein